MLNSRLLCWDSKILHDTQIEQGNNGFIITLWLIWQGNNTNYYFVTWSNTGDLIVRENSDVVQNELDRKDFVSFFAVNWNRLQTAKIYYHKYVNIIIVIYFHSCLVFNVFTSN